MLSALGALARGVEICFFFSCGDGLGGGGGAGGKGDKPSEAEAVCGGCDGSVPGRIGWETSRPINPHSLKNPRP